MYNKYFVCTVRSTYIWIQAQFFSKNRMHWWAPQHKRPERTTVEDDRRILSIVKINYFTTSGNEKNTLQGVDVSLSKSRIKRRLHRSKYRGFMTRCKQGQIRPKTSKKLDHLWKSILWTSDIKINLYQNYGKKKVWRRLGAVRWHEHAWLSVALGYWCLVMM